MSLLARAPKFTLQDAERIALDVFGMRAAASSLTSERDQNFLMAPAGDGERRVLKIANSTEDPALLEAQAQAMARVADRTGLTQRVLPTTSGELVGSVEAPDGVPHRVRLVSYVDGVPAARVPRQSAGYRRDLGRCIALVDNALDGFDHPAAHRSFYWDLARGLDVCRQRLPVVASDMARDIVTRLLQWFERDVAPTLDDLPQGVIHNDANDWNVIVRGDGDAWTRGQRVAAIIDFGDMVHSWTVGDIAIAATYAALPARDPLSAAADVVRGYHAERPLGEAEIAALFGLIALRMCTSVCVAAQQTRDRPGDDYLSVSQEALTRALPIIASTHPKVAEAAFRDACGLEPSKSAVSVARHLRKQNARPILGRPLDAATTMAIPLDVASALVSAEPDGNAEPLLSARIESAMKAAGASIVFGGYGEARLLYTTPGFADPVADPGERRTVHLGVDFFGPPGTPVHAPIDGTVAAAARIPDDLDYGAVIVLEHRTGDGIAFQTLYGHLSAASIDGMKPGRAIKAGERIGEFGEPGENGGWTPHLHFQVITELLDLRTACPGVARPAHRQVWLSLMPDPSPLLGLPAERVPAPAPDKAATLAERKLRLGGNVGIAYRDPVKVVRGWMQHLFDDDGRRYLDAYNNVPHVGHSHPRVVATAATQMAVLNTNTRYLHDAVIQFAERLSETLPPSLSRVFFVNSGSEANELALRLARAHTGRRDMIVLDAAYHGITSSLIDLSPYKHAGPGGAGAPDWVHAVPMPDDYRGQFKRGDPKAGEKYAALVEPHLASVCAFMAESLPSVGGQIVLPEGYLRGVYRRVRDAGGVCIADEVQTGYGRIGTHFWGFEQQDVTPDIVVLGKPIGNGYPIGAVITTPEIARSFDNGMEFFSTFGGSTVAAVVGLEVLNVTLEERLQDHALRVGGRMLDQLRPFVERYSVVGDVRGSGLFLGVELVRDRMTLEPAAEEAAYVVNRMREEGILLGTDGPYHNVLKIRPPMPFTAQDGDALVDALQRIIAGELTQPWR